MGINERRKRERLERRKLILDAASEILIKDGIEGISIRKIADKIEYSPSIIYHYFKDKDDIIGHLMQQGYKKIVNGLSSIQTSTDQPDKKLKDLTRKYIEVALEMSEDFKTVQLNNSPEVLKHTASLFKGAADNKPALRILCESIRAIYNDEVPNDELIELTAQIIATASLGLIIRLIIEKDLISEEQRERLIEHHTRCVVDGMLLGKPVTR